MKKLLGLMCLLLMLSGCSRENKQMQQALDLRTAVLGAESCSFDCRITADYGDTIHSFSLTCQGDRQGNLTFTVTEPDTISGISGKISRTGGQLTFDETALQFDLLTDDQLSPISAPWIFLKTLREGYLLTAGTQEGNLIITAKDSYEEDALLAEITVNTENLPCRGEIFYRNRKILTLEIGNFRLGKARPQV